MSGAWESLEYRDFRYRLQQIDVRDNDKVPEIHSRLAVRCLVTAEGRHLVLKSVHRPTGTADPSLYDLLDREIRAGCRLLRRYPADYPAELSKLVGYDIDCEEPFVLLEQYQGVPVANQTGRLLNEQQVHFQAGLFRALRLLEAAKLVHGGLTPETVRQNDRQVQVVCFEHAALIGEPIVHNGRSRWCSPAQRSGTGAMTHQDDIWSAGAIVLSVVTGQAPGLNPDPNRAGGALGDLLSGVFEPDLRDRPTATELLGRLGRNGTVPPRTDSVAKDFSQSRLEFDKVLADKLSGSSDEDGDVTGHKSSPRLVRSLVAVVIMVAVLVTAGFVFGVFR